ncbi:MAG: DUF3298 domain-containing protein [bacterium]|nr:DUF3298 domain-containing protein [bacterium]
MRKPFLAGVLIILTLSCAKEKESAQLPPPEEETTSQAGDTLGLLPLEEPAAISDSTAAYRYSARFPRTGEPIVDTLIEQFVKTQIDSFVALAPDSLTDQTWPSELDINYSSSVYPPSIVCFKFDSYQFTGGAHGMTTVTTLNFNLATRNLLLLTDLFERRAKVAESLSVYSRAELRQTLGEMLVDEMLEVGTEPDLANFSRFMLAPRDLVIFFEPYAVAPYAAGEQVVSIPLARLEKLLKPEFRPKAEAVSDSTRSQG